MSAYHKIFKSLLLAILMALIAGPTQAQQARWVPVNVFGDGDPSNGVEDDRQPLFSGRQRGLTLADQGMNAGTIKCDGRIRGTAVVIDTRQFAPTLKGAILASAAHVIYDLEKKRPFKRCEFHFLALSEISRYRVKIDLKQLRMGSFDPGKAVNEPGFGVGDWVFLYVPRPWKRFNLNEALLPRVFSLAELAAFEQTGGELRLIAYDTAKKVMSVSRHCSVIQSRQGDLGGGAWQGQLLDDCDSAGGASGGGLIAVLQGKHYLVGIRNGSHWSAKAFPVKTYPSGPPAGSRWNRRTNTNFGRALDDHILSELEIFSRELEATHDQF